LPDPQIAGLPSRFCKSVTGALLSQYVPVEGDLGRDVERLGVQVDAFDEFGVRQEAPARIFAIAPRLYGECAPVQPCWEWDVVARLDDPSEPAEQTPQPTVVEQNITCSGGSGSISVLDNTGLVVECLDIGAIDHRSISRQAVNPDNTASTLRIQWNAGTCFDRGVLDFAKRGDRYLVSIQGPTPSSDCFMEGRAFDLVLRSPVSAGLVDVEINEPQPAPTRFECVGPPLPPGTPPDTGPLPVVIDETGLVAFCNVPDVLVERNGPISVSNSFDETSLFVTWEPGVCDAAIAFTLTALSDGSSYALSGERPSDCPGAEGGSSTISIQLTQPMPANQVLARLTDDDSSLECAEDVDIVDHAGLVVACSSLPVERPAEPIEMRRGDRPDLIEVLWQTTCSFMPATLDLWQRNPAFIERQPEDYVVVVDRRQTTGSTGCHTALGGQGVVLTLDRGINVFDFDAFLTYHRHANLVVWHWRTNRRFGVLRLHGRGTHAEGHRLHDSVLRLRATGRGPSPRAAADRRHVPAATRPRARRAADQRLQKPRDLVAH
jgi:hypothetical protein